MELRVLEYFLVVADELNFTKAADILHITQPTLSRQIQAMEEELGKTLFIRGKKGTRKLELTEEGKILQKRAQEIRALVQKTEDEITLPENSIEGTIYIGAAKTNSFRYIGDVLKKLQDDYPKIQYDIFSSNRDAIIERLDKGLIGFGIIYERKRSDKYEYIDLPFKDSYGILMPSDVLLTHKNYITPEDLYDKPLVIPRRKKEILNWLGKKEDEVNIKVIYNLIYDAVILTSKHFGYTFTLDSTVINNDDLCFIPLSPPLEIQLSIVYKKNQVFSKASEKLLSYFKDAFVLKKSESIL